MLGDVRLAQRVPAFARRAVDRHRGHVRRLARHVVIAAMARVERDDGDHFGGAAHDERVALDGDPRARCDDTRADRQRQLRVDPRRGLVVAEEDEVGPARLGLADLSRLQVHRDIERTRPVDGQPHGDHPVDRTGEHLADMMHARARERHARDRRIEIERAFVAIGRRERGQRECQVARGLVGHLLERARHHSRIDQRLRVGIAAFEHHPANVGERAARLRAVGAIGAAGVQRIAIELEPFAARTAEHHGADAAVADRQRLRPGGGRLAIPESPRVVGTLARLSDRRRGAAQQDRRARGAGLHRLSTRQGIHGRTSFGRCGSVGGELTRSGLGGGWLSAFRCRCAMSGICRPIAGSRSAARRCGLRRSDR